MRKGQGFREAMGCDRQGRVYVCVRAVRRACASTGLRIFELCTAVLNLRNNVMFPEGTCVRKGDNNSQVSSNLEFVRLA